MKDAYMVKIKFTFKCLKAIIWGWSRGGRGGGGGNALITDLSKAFH